MKKIVLSLGLIFISFGSLYAQRGQVTPTPLPEDSQRQRTLDQQSDINRRSNELRNVENFPQPVNLDSKIYREHIRPLYREPKGDELKVIAPGDEDAAKFGEFLRQPRTGLTKLVPEKNCASDVNVTSASPDCAKYAFPGAGSSYSFRVDNYRMAHLADLNYTGKVFRAFGVLTHGILVSLGDTPLEKIDLQSEAVKGIMKLEPASDFKEAEEFALKLDKGVQNKEYTYRNVVPATENTTYLLRSIAYKGNSIRSAAGISFDEMELDKRKEVVVAFRVVRRDADGSATILWKELASKNSPKLKPAK